MIISLREMQSADLDQVHRIEKRSFSDPWSKAIFVTEMIDRGYNHNIVAVDEDRDEIVGYCMFWVVPEHTIHINNIAVHPDVRRQGVAELLLHHTLQTGRNEEVYSAVLEVRESNTAAIQFYQKHGFIEISRRKNYYQKPKEDALILQCVLPKSE